MIRKDNINFDVESGPQAEEKLAVVRPPFDPASVKGADKIGKPFLLSAVKTGQRTDPDKIQAYLEEAEKKHTDDFAEKAALDACRGQVLAIGYLSERGPRIDDRDEKSMLVQFWDIFQSASGDGRKMVGFNIHGFDLPMLVRRTWLLGLHVPIDVIDRNRFWHPCFIDLAEVYRLGVYGEYKGINEIGLSMGIGGKLDGISGKDFHKLWAEDRQKAKEYLLRDLELTKGIAERILPCVQKE